MHSTNSNCSVTSILANASIFHAKKTKSGYSAMWLNSMTHLQNKYAQIGFLQAGSGVSATFLPFCIWINLHQIAEAFCQFRRISIRFTSGSSECSRVLCDVLSDENEKPQRSKHEIQQLCIDNRNAKTSNALSSVCKEIPKWSFPIERKPSKAKWRKENA